jgi:hypothetical protein
MDEGLFLGTPPGQSWPLTATALEEQLRQRFPGAFTRRATSGVTGAEALDFEVPLADGDTHGGSYTETGVLALTDGPPHLWADTMVWFLRLLPPTEPVYAMREDNPTPTPLPTEARTDPDALASFFENLAP